MFSKEIEVASTSYLASLQAMSTVSGKNDHPGDWAMLILVAIYHVSLGFHPS